MPVAVCVCVCVCACVCVMLVEPHGYGVFERGQSLPSQLISSNKPVVLLHCSRDIWLIINKIRHSFIFNTTVYGLFKLTWKYLEFISSDCLLPCWLWPPPQHSSPVLRLLFSFFLFCLDPRWSGVSFWLAVLKLLHRHRYKDGSSHHFPDCKVTQVWFGKSLEFWLISLFSWPGGQCRLPHPDWKYDSNYLTYSGI